MLVYHERQNPYVKKRSVSAREQPCFLANWPVKVPIDLVSLNV